MTTDRYMLLQTSYIICVHFQCNFFLDPLKSCLHCHKNAIKIYTKTEKKLTSPQLQLQSLMKTTITPPEPRRTSRGRLQNFPQELYGNLYEKPVRLSKTLLKIHNSFALEFYKNHENLYKNLTSSLQNFTKTALYLHTRTLRELYHNFAEFFYDHYIARARQEFHLNSVTAPSALCRRTLHRHLRLCKGNLREHQNFALELYKASKY